MIYLDNAATTFPKPKEVTDVYTQWGCEMPVDAPEAEEVTVWQHRRSSRYGKPVEN